MLAHWKSDQGFFWACKVRWIVSLNHWVVIIRFSMINILSYKLFLNLSFNSYIHCIASYFLYLFFVANFLLISFCFFIFNKLFLFAKYLYHLSDNDFCPLSINTFSTDMICAVEGKEVDAPKAQRVTFLNNHFFSFKYFSIFFLFAFREENNLLMLYHREPNLVFINGELAFLNILVSANHIFYWFIEICDIDVIISS